MKPQSQRHHRSYRIRTQEQPTERERQGPPLASRPNSIVFQSQVKSLQNYFQFLQTTFGKKIEIKQMVKNVPHGKLIHEQFSKTSTKKRSKSEYIYEQQAFQYIKIKSSTTGGLYGCGKTANYRNGCKHSLIQIPSSRLKMKYYDSQRKRHSYLMQRMSNMPRKVNTSPIQNQQFLNRDENSEFLPVGRCINKDDRKNSCLNKPRQKLSAELMKGINYKRPKHELLLIKHQSQIKHSCRVAQKNDDTVTEGPWRIVDTTQYNPRSYYSTYR